MGYPQLLLAFLILNPFVYKYVWIKLVGATWWRMLWMMCEGIVCVYAMMDLSDRVKRKSLKVLVLVVGVTIFMMTGTFAYQKFKPADNSLKIPQSTIDVADALLALDDSPKAVVPASIYCYIRQYTNDIKLLYGRDANGYILWIYGREPYSVYSELKSDSPNYEYIANTCRANGVEYMVFRGKKHKDIENYGYVLVEKVSGYWIYQNMW
jgi:hypothetical protein